MTKLSTCQGVQAKQVLQQLLVTFHAADQQPQWLLVQMLASQML